MSDTSENVARPTDGLSVPPMGGLAIMAAELAGRRVSRGSGRFGGMTTFKDQFHVVSRKDCITHEQYGGGVPLTSSEYYRIIDRIARGEKP